VSLPKKAHLGLVAGLAVGAITLSACSAGSLGTTSSSSASGSAAANVTITLLADNSDSTTKSVIVTIVVVQSIFVFNDFQNPLYFLPGSQNATVQLTLFNYMSQSQTTYNLLFASVLVITIPMLVMYIIFQRQIVAGMTSGAVKD